MEASTVKIARSTSHRSPLPEPQLNSNRRRGIVILVALGSLLCTGSTAPTQCSGFSGGIGPSNGEIAAAAVGIVAVPVAVVTVIAVEHSHHTLQGCVFSGPGGLELRTNDAKTYKLEGDAASIKVGDRVKFHGSHVKKAKHDDAGEQVFKVEKLSKDYGPCPVAVANAATPAH
jgi:hypothetical protein